MSESLETAVRDGFRAAEQQRALTVTRVTLVLGVLAYVAFGFIDRLVTHQHLDELLFVRAAVIVLLGLVTSLTFLPGAVRFARPVGWLMGMIGAMGTVVVTALVGGGDSHYFLALVVLYFTYASLMPSTLWLCATFVTIPTLFYGLMMVRTEQMGSLGTFATNLAILGFAMSMSLAGQVLGNRLRLHQYRLDLTLRRAHEQLRHLDATKNEFFANISHQLRTPLTLILASTESLREAIEARGESVPRDLVACRRNGIRLLREVDALLELSRLQSSAVRRRVRRFDLRAMVQDLAVQLTPLAARKQITVVTDLGGERGLQIEADDNQIERIWLNLSENAIKFTNPGGTVTLGLRHESETSCEGWVSDTGNGMSPELLASIFETANFLPSSGGNGRRSGAGLGISLVRGIVEVHGGKMMASSALGRGTKVSFFLPRDSTALDDDRVERRGEQVLTVNERRRDGGLAEWDGVLRRQDEYRLWGIAEATERDGEPHVEALDHGPCVLLVDDNRDVLELLAGVLGGTYRLATATDGSEGLARARKLRPDLVLSDVMMPGLNGFELLAALRADPDLRTTPVVLLTARGHDEHRIAAGEGGADAYLAKPFHPQELRTVLRNILRKQEAQAAAVIDERALALRVMAEGIAHDVLNPLGFVRGSLLILSRLNEELVELCGPGHVRAAEIGADSKKFQLSGDEGIQRTIAAIGELRRFSRGDTTAQVARIEVNEAVRRTIAVVATQGQVTSALRAKNAVSLRSGQLEQVLLNLILNAQQAAGAGSKIHVTSWDDAATGAVGVAVRDNGPGMDRSTLQRVFDPYFTTKQMGTGLGLTVSRQIIRDGRGTLNVESQTGEGTTFTILLPAAAAAA